MTSRLRKKLEDLEEAGNNLNESFCLIGTPLPSLAETKRDQNEFVPVWKQEVRDEQGRRRFHGAFTGGYSAGYYNSVGSKEGWAPASFKSSRSNRVGNTSKQQTAEDFMDEEDLADLRDSRKLENTETFKSDGFTSTADELGRPDSIGSALTSLIQPASSSVGQKLLMKMGWRPGQGIGPRVSARKRTIQEAKISGRRTRLDVDELPAADEEEGKHLFAPRDSKLMVFEQKTGKEGLGYVKGQGMQSLPNRDITRNEQPTNLSAGFGLGIDEADEDDLDIYHTDSNRAEHNARMAYDLEDQDNDVVLLGPGAVGAKKTRRETADTGEERRTYKKRTDADENRPGNVWNDGRPVLPGFVIDPNATAQDTWFEFPPIPDGWRPRPARVWHKGTKWDQMEMPAPRPPPNASADKRSQLSADQRGDILGEEQLKTSAKSVFDYMSAKSKERLAQATGSHQATGVSLTVEEPLQDREGVVVPPLSPRTASAALKGFIPFADDSSKQERYKSYLVSQTHNTPEPNPKLLPGRPVNEINKELSDFSKSAAMFKPMSFAMANRFTTSSTSVQDLVQPKPGLHIPDPDKLDEWTDTSKTETEVKEVLTPRQEAAKAGMYGKMTRTEENWAPNKLLCKRFGVADPFPDGLPGAAKKEDSVPTGGTFGTRSLLTAPGHDVAWQNKFINVTPTDNNAQNGTETGASGNGPRQPKTLAEVGLADDENQGRDTLTYKKPAIDIFKAIFADDEDDQDEDDDDTEEAKSANRTASSTPSLALPSKLRQTISAPSAREPSASISVQDADTQASSTAYRPVFARPSTKRDIIEVETDSLSQSTATGIDGGKSKRTKKEKKKANKILMSFDAGEEDEEALYSRESKRDKRNKKDRRKEKSGEPSGADEEDMWVEKEVVVPSAPVSKRKRAEDFL